MKTLAALLLALPALAAAQSVQLAGQMGRKALLVVDGQTAGQIGRGLLVLAGVEKLDDEATARRLLDRTAPSGCVVFHFEAGVLDEDDFDDDLDLDLRGWGTTAIAMMWRKGEAPERLQRRWQKERADAADT